MRTRRFLVASILAGAMSFGTVLPATAASPQHRQDGLINVAIGDITITDAVDVNVAANIAATICGVDVGPVAILGRAVDLLGRSRTVCVTRFGPVTLVQNN